MARGSSDSSAPAVIRSRSPLVSLQSPRVIILRIPAARSSTPSPAARARPTIRSCILHCTTSAMDASREMQRGGCRRSVPTAIASPTLSHCPPRNPPSSLPAAHHPSPPCGCFPTLSLLCCAVSALSRLGCGCACYGLEGETDCPPCLEHQLAVADAVCCICYLDALRAAPCIQLSAPCLHTFHHRCIVQQLRARWPGLRLSFRFLLCPLCSEPLSHPSLTDLLAPLLQLRGAAEQRALTRLYAERRDRDDAVALSAGAFHGDELAYAMHIYAFYRCHQVSTHTLRRRQLT